MAEYDGWYVATVSAWRRRFNAGPTLEALDRHWPAVTPMSCILLLGLLSCRRQCPPGVCGYATGQLRGIDPMPAQRRKRWADIGPTPI